MNHEIMGWSRNTPWRQGHILSRKAIEELGLLHVDTPDTTCVIVISHDCDLANDNPAIEPDVEIIIGRHPNKKDGNYFWAKSPRTLHLDALHENVGTVIELISTAKQFISKSNLAAYTPDRTYTLSGSALSILRTWLAVRYNRAAFPDAFVNFLSSSNIDKGLAKLIEPMENRLSAVYFDLDKGTEIDHSDGSCYELTIILVYPPKNEPLESADEVELLCKKINDLFTKKCFKNNFWSNLALKDCLAISEDDITVSQTRLLTEWRLEHMTLKENTD